MKRFLLLTAIVIGFSGLRAQVISFSPEQDAFMKELGDFMGANNNEIGKDSYNRFAKEVDAGNITAEQVDMIIALSNKMADYRMKPTPQYVAVLDATVAFVKSGQFTDRYAEWMEIVNTLLDNSKKGSYSVYNHYLEFSTAFFSKYALNETPTKTWSFSSPEYQLKLNGEIPEVHIQSTSIIGSTKGDTLYINETSGVYYPLDQKWVGTGGTMHWGRAGLDSTTTYAKFNHYVINTNDNEYRADTVQFYYGSLFSKPLNGYVVDRLITNNVTSKSDYPQFHSYNDNLAVKDILKNVDYKGGFFLKGNQIIGSGTDSVPAVMLFKDVNGKPSVQARSKNFLITPEVSVYSRDCEAIIFVGKKDSIYHHDVSIGYNSLENKMNITRQEEGFSSLMFYSSYHKIDAKVDNLSWILGDTVIKMKNLEGAGTKLSWFESQDLYNRVLFDRIRGVATYQPLVKIKRYCETYKTRVIPSLALAKELNPSLTVDGIQSLMLTLVEEGFIFYDKENELIYVKDKVFNYVLAASKKQDYDIINIPSKAKDANATLDLDDYDLHINGIKQFYLSDSQFVLIYPTDDKIIMKKGRDMLFDGTIVSGNIDFIGKNYYFSYDTFNIKMTNVDSMILYVESVDMDDMGNSLYLPVKTNITVSSGKLQIDKADNKSSKVNNPMYSIFTTYDYSVADYMKPEIFDNVYQKDDFFFKLDPFTLTSSDSLDYRQVKFQGSMVSDGIFPDFREALMLQEDRSLGFKSVTPPGGYPMYGKSGKYNGNISLSNKGFRGSGKIDFMASTSTSQDIIFFPDSTIAKVDDFVVAKTEKGVQFPQSSNSGTSLRWLPYEDKMYVKQGQTPFSMFDGAATQEGTAIVTSHGLLGDGTMNWGEVKAISNQFVYDATHAKADTSKVTIGQISPGVVALKIDNVKMNVDFTKRIGNFKSNVDSIFTYLPYNEYKTDMNEFDWIMDDRVVEFKSTKEYANFYSTNGTQDSLVFQAKVGKYNLNNFLLAAEGVPLIRIADVHVIPDSGKVYVEKGAKMRTLYYAKIFGDTVNNYHKITNAKVTILGRYSMTGTGEYEYITPQNKKEMIPFESITVRSVIDSIMGQTDHKILGKGYIQDSSKFVLEDNVSFKGPVELYSEDQFLRFKGYIKLAVADTANFRPDWFRINSSIDSKNPVFNLDDAVTEKNDSVFAGIFRFNDTAAVYTTIMSRKHSISDANLFIARGKGFYNELDQTYYFGNFEKLDDPTAKGSILKYNNKTGAIYAEGRLKLGLKTDLCDTKAYGTIIKRPNYDEYKMDATIMSEIPLPDELMKKLGELIYTTNSDAGANPINFETETQIIGAIQELLDEKMALKLINDINSKGYLEKPKDLPMTLFLSGIKMIWDPSTRSFHTTDSKAKVIWIGDQLVNQEIKCFAEFGKRYGGDYFTIYLETPNADYIYINYKKNVMKIYSSREEINSEIFGYDTKQRQVETTKGNMIFVLENKNAVNEFIQNMEYFEGLKK